jgi:membrane-bound ClpP family serine protease
MILMPLVMVSPLAALLLFYYLPFATALLYYTPILIVAGFCQCVMFKSMRAKVKTGLEAMMGGEALVIKDIDPEGKVRFRDEIWTAAARGNKIVVGERVKILDAEGLILIVERLHEDEEGANRNN